MRLLCPASLLSKIEQASQAEAELQGAWNMYQPAQSDDIFLKVGTPNLYWILQNGIIIAVDLISRELGDQW